MTSHLVILGNEIATQDLKQLAKISRAEQIQAVNPSAFRLVNADSACRNEIAAYCDEAKLDFGFIQNGQSLQDIGLVVMDMDSTLINIECIDEIADFAGIKPQVAEVTEAAMRGEIDFKESLTRRVALLKGLDAGALDHVYEERLKINPGGELMLKALQKQGVKTLLVSGGFTFFTERLQKRLGLDYAHSNLLEIVDGKLTGKVASEILDAQGKADKLCQVRNELGLRKEQVIAMGDGANDLKMMAEAGYSIAYHAKPVVRAQASYAFNHVGLDGLLGLFAPQ